MTMRRRAFTLIEMMVVCAILAMFSALVLPSVVAMKAGRERDEAYENVLRLARQGREAAIQSGRTYVLKLEDGGTRVTLGPDEETSGAALTRSGDVETETSGNLNSPKIGASIGVMGSAAGTSSNSANVRDGSGSVDLPQDVTMGQLVLAGKASSTSDFVLHFYPDGRSEGGGFELVDRGATRNLSVTTRGLSSLETGPLPQAAEESWEAGQYEQRASS